MAFRWMMVQGGRYCEEAGVLLHAMKEVSFQNFPSWQCFSLLELVKVKIGRGPFEKLGAKCFSYF